LTAAPRTSELDAPVRGLPHVHIVRARPRHLAQSIAEILGLAILFALSLEAACRIEDWVEFRTPIFARERSQADLLIRDPLGMHGRPGGRFQKWSLNTFGMRGSEVPLAKAPHTIRVVAVGASETFGLYESPEHEYPRQLEDTLNTRLAVQGASCAGWHAQVLNAAMPGMSLPTINQDIRLRVAPLRPDYIVVYPTPSVYLEDAVPVPARPDSVHHAGRQLPWSSALFPRVADRIRVQLKAVLPTTFQDMIRRREISAMVDQHGRGWRYESVPADRLKMFEADLRRSVGIIRSTGAMPVLMTHANRFVGSPTTDAATLRAWEKFYPRATGQTIVAFDSVARLRAAAVAGDSATVLVDLAPTLARSHGSVFADYSHFTDLGAALTAGAVGASLIPPPTTTPAVSCMARPNDPTAAQQPAPR
jgi:hypothetical protein